MSLVAPALATAFFRIFWEGLVVLTDPLLGALRPDQLDLYLCYSLPYLFRNIRPPLSPRDVYLSLGASFSSKQSHFLSFDFLPTISVLHADPVL